MADEVKKPKSKKELIDSDPEGLTAEELLKRAAFIQLESQEAQLELTRHQNAEFKMKQQEKKDKFRSRGFELGQTARNQKMRESACSHFKGGMDADGYNKGGSDPRRAVIRHLMPWNEWFQRCQRCGQTWRRPYRKNYPEGQEGQRQFDEAVSEYKSALSWNTDNTPSTSGTWQFHSEDGDVSAREFIRTQTANITLR